MTLPFEPTAAALALAFGCALLIGISKTSVGGIATLAVAGFANLMPVKESTAAVLLLLIIGDIVAVISYHQHANWRLLRRLLPAVLPGIVLGALFLNVVPDNVMRPILGVLLIAMVGLQVWQRRPKASQEVANLGPGVAVGAGIAAGFTTMVANAAGPVMSVYLLAERLSKTAFIGTGAWYFLIINVSKVPFSVGLGLLHITTLWLALLMAPAVLIGTFIGRLLLKRISQTVFERVTLVASAIGAVSLLVPR